MERRLNQRFSCAIYALIEDPDYLVFEPNLTLDSFHRIRRLLVLR